MVHIIPNAGVVALALLYGAGDFSRTLQIANMCGWDTDCNVGNVGAIMGTALGLSGIDDSWRTPINDLLIASSIIGTRNLLTIPQCADLFCALGRKLGGRNCLNRARATTFAIPARPAISAPKAKKAARFTGSRSAVDGHADAANVSHPQAEQKRRNSRSSPAPITARAN